jgi:NADP-dependent 3-hydroxy acid dehydrogenase YdfG
MPLSVRTSETTLSQRVYVVTGARSGIAAASANKLASKTATAVVADFDEVAGQPGRG